MSSLNVTSVLSVVLLLVLLGATAARPSSDDAPPSDTTRVASPALPRPLAVHTPARAAGVLGALSPKPAAPARIHAALSESAARQADPDECFDCHDDESLTMEKDGREISLYVNPEAYAASIHAGADCLDCHAGFDPYDIPHKDPITPVDCATCHDGPTQTFRRSGHAGELSCATCHGDVHTPPSVAPAQTCQTCHDDALAAVDESVHANVEGGPGCVDCHSAHAAEPADTDQCLACHGQDDAEHQEMLLEFQDSVHGDLIECSDCHGGHDILPLDDTASPVAPINVAEACAECHPDIAESFLASEHGQALQDAAASAPTCTDCHGEHDILSVTDGESRVSREHEVQVCLSCHLDAPEVRDRMTHSSAFVAGYVESIHGRAFEAGNPEAAVCSDCHGAHEAMKASDPASKVNKFNLANTCGTCHDEVSATFAASIHGEALLDGVADAPTCTDCHGEHAIFEHTNEESPVAFANVSQQTCSPCHTSVKLSEKYGFPSDRTSSFADSYHGLAGRFGSEEVANCASCHGVHDILPSSDPRSKVNKANLQETCGQCHPGANMNFARGNIHVIRTPEGDRVLYWISRVYIFLIVVIIGAMAVHNGLDWFRKLQDKYLERLAPPPVVERKTALYVRMTANERVQHAVLALSFITLVITGFMLKFPDAWWVRILRDLFGASLVELRGIVHRIAGVIMIGGSVYHLYYVAFTERGRQFLRDIMLRRSDLTELIQSVKHLLGLSDERPRYGRFNYIEKSEYWALVWGTVIMSLTGIVLWFEEPFMGGFSKLFVDANETVHYFEAWLAFLAIVVWHIYYVIFNPDVYPMNFTWLTGRITEEEMEHEHPRELERLKEAEAEAATEEETG